MSWPTEAGSPRRKDLLIESLPGSSAAASEPFRFLVGPDKREFTMHTSVVAHQSRALSALVNGDFKEAVDGAVEWDDIDELTFSSFWQFAYAGNYNLPDELLTPSKAIYANDEPGPAEVEHPTFEEEVWGLRGLSVKKRKTTGRRQTVWSDFQSVWKVDMAAYDPPNRGNRKPVDDAAVLLHHARVYVMADRYGIPRLMALSFQKLHQSLVKYSISEENIGTIIEVLRFCCSELVPDKLRHLLAHYAACNIKTLWKREEFQELAEGCGTLSAALIGPLLRRIEN